MSEADTAALPVDWEEGLARAGDDPEFYRELLELFLDDVPSRLSALRDALESGDCASAASAAHSIKGAAANLSARGVREQAHAVEKSSRAGELDGIAPQAEALEKEIDRLRSFAEQL
jgi:HPt (histidine-containing phosphotransfer) domain-containing protein